MNDKIVEILSAAPGKRGAYLKHVYNTHTGQYRGPILPRKDEEIQEIERLFKLVQTDKKLGDIIETIAIIDTGVLQDHPLIKPQLIKSVDFTGEGIEDLSGHGTAVALLATQSQYIQYTPDLKLQLLSVKALDAEGRGTSENMIKAIDWAVENEATVINISAGIFHRKWGLFDCRGSCEVCRAAERAAMRGVMVLAAAGNESGKVYCPATVGVFKDSGVIAVAVTDLEGRPLPNTGYGNITAVGEYWFGPIESK